MNGVIESYSIKMKQTSKGIWYCDNVDVWREDPLEAVNDIDQVMTQVEGVLWRHNNQETENKDPKSAWKVKEKWQDKINEASGKKVAD